MGFLENLFASNIKKELKNLEDKYDEATKKIIELESNIDISKSEIIVLNSKLSNFNMNELSLNNEILSLKSELSKSKFLLDDFERKNKDLNTKLNNSSSNDSKTNELSKNYIKELSSKNEDLIKEVSFLKDENFNLKNRTYELDSKITNCENLIKELKEKNVNLEKELKNNLSKLSEFQNTNTEKSDAPLQGFKGDMSDVNLFEFLQMMILTKKEKLICFTDLSKNKEGNIYLKDGEIIHSEFDGKEGLEAFLSIVSIKNGRFDVLKWVDPKEKTIDIPAMNLFMEASRIIDEKEAVIKSLEVDIGKENISESDLQNKSQNIINSIDQKRRTLNMSSKEAKELRDIMVKNITNSGDHKVEKIRIRKILVVDDSPTIITIMKKYLLSQEYDVVTESSSVRALELLKNEKFDLLITDIDMPEVNGIELFLWVKENNPNTQVIMMTAFGSDEIKEFANSVGALKYFEKPLNMKHVKEVLDEINQNKEGLKGSVEDISIFDFVQMIVLSRKQKLITVFDPITKQKAKLFVSFGEIINAECGNLKGEEAFYSIMAMKSGTFKDEQWQETEKIILTKPMRLFMEATRRIDEQINNLNDIQDNNKLLNETKTKSNNTVNEALSLTINEFERSVLGLRLNITTKKETQEILKGYSYNDSINPNLIIYDSLSIILLFDKNSILSEITFGLNYKGETSKGLKIGDSIEKAVSIYGTPTLSSDKVIVWNNLYAFHQNNNLVYSMSIR
ncbi:MAG: DUF4388 domain-containing protein [Candidatus Sericytochromatia bacterium]